MINAYFDYAPVGESIFVLELPEEEPRETNLHIQDPASLIEAVTTFIQVNGVDHLYCNAPAMCLVDKMKEYLQTKYNYTKCEFAQYS